jgi:hypothetical protein
MRVAQRDGFLSAVVALWERVRRCRPGYEIVQQPNGKEHFVVFADGTPAPIGVLSEVLKREISLGHGNDRTIAR